MVGVMDRLLVDSICPLLGFVLVGFSFLCFLGHGAIPGALEFLLLLLVREYETYPSLILVEDFSNIFLSSGKLHGIWLMVLLQLWSIPVTPSTSIEPLMFAFQTNP